MINRQMISSFMHNAAAAPLPDEMSCRSDSRPAVISGSSTESVVGGGLIPKVGMPATSTSIRTFMAAPTSNRRDGSQQNVEGAASYDHGANMPREDASRPSVSSESRVMHLASTLKR